MGVYSWPREKHQGYKYEQGRSGDEGFAFSCIKLDNKCADAGIVSDIVYRCTVMWFPFLSLNILQNTFVWLISQSLLESDLQ